MNIRTKLFLFIPLLVVLLNIFSFFIFQSGKAVQESYNTMMQRILLYKQVSTQVQESLRDLSRFLIHQDQESLQGLYSHQRVLEGLKIELSQQEQVVLTSQPIQNYLNMIDTFLEQQDAVMRSIEQNSISEYAAFYAEAEKMASFIQEDGQRLVDLELSYYQPTYRDILHKTQDMNELGGYLFVVTTLLSVVLAFWISQTITKPIQGLVENAKQIAKGNLDIQISRHQTKDEIGILEETFHQMVQDLKDLISKNIKAIESARLVKELELKALQSQINPHFLFNTLNVISKLAYIEGAEKTSELTVSTSNLLRYNLRKLDQPVPLLEEVEHAKEYFAIQRARFRDRVVFHTKINEIALDHMLPCLTLQPLLENAFIHGIEEMEEGAVLELEIEKEEDQVVVMVRDNGAGMEASVQDKLLDLEDTMAPLPAGEKPKSTGLGTRNVFKRLMLFYGGNAQIKIESEKNRGTSIILTMPYTQRGDFYVSNDDRG